MRKGEFLKKFKSNLDMDLEEEQIAKIADVLIDTVLSCVKQDRNNTLNWNESIDFVFNNDVLIYQDCNKNYCLLEIDTNGNVGFENLLSRDINIGKISYPITVDSNEKDLPVEHIYINHGRRE